MRHPEQLVDFRAKLAVWDATQMAEETKRVLGLLEDDGAWPLKDCEFAIMVAALRELATELEVVAHRRALAGAVVDDPN